MLVSKIFKLVGEKLFPPGEDEDGSEYAWTFLNDIVTFKGDKKTLYKVLDMTKAEVKSMSPVVRSCGILPALIKGAMSEPRRSTNSHLMDFLAVFQCVRKTLTDCKVLMHHAFQMTQHVID